MSFQGKRQSCKGEKRAKNSVICQLLESIILPRINVPEFPYDNEVGDLFHIYLYPG